MKAAIIAGARQGPGMKEAVEITTFRLVRNATLTDFIAANMDVDAWLLRQPGFRSRRIAQRHDGVIVDMLLWDTPQQAEVAMQRLLEELSDSPVHALIDPRSVSWTVASVGHSTRK